jgi:hypothetical protein
MDWGRSFLSLMRSVVLGWVLMGTWYMLAHFQRFGWGERILAVIVLSAWWTVVLRWAISMLVDRRGGEEDGDGGG